MADSSASGVQDANRIYDLHVKPVEDLHRGEYAVVWSDGQTVFAGTLLDAARLAHRAPSADNFIFKVGERVLGKLR